MEQSVNILTVVLDDERLILERIGAAFKECEVENYTLFNNPIDFLNNKFEDVHICVVDYLLKGYKITGLDIMNEVLTKNPRCYVIVISAQTDISVVVDFLNHGAYKYIDKLKNNFIDELILFVKAATTEVLRDLKFYQTLITRQKKLQEVIDKNPKLSPHES